MQVKIDIECTPLEARAFFGLPDVTPLNDQLVEEMSIVCPKTCQRLSPKP